MNTSQRRKQQLGIPHGTAMGKLRLKILFHILKKYGENICFKCGKKISKMDDLSIEHKQPWEGHPENNNRRFWHMSNISFSHRKCNRPHTRGGIKLRKTGPKGTAWCHICKQFLPKDKFYKDKSKWNGVRYHCIKCKRVLDKKRNRRRGG